jgi:hypothetical protein
MTALEAYRAGVLALPPRYDLELSEGLLLLRRDDDTLATAFPAGKVTPSEVAWSAEEDRRTRSGSSA